MRAPIDDRKRHAAGMTVRRVVLGNVHVDHTNATQTDLTAPFQDFITRYAWGEIWMRPGLPHHIRSLLMIAMMVVPGRDGELRLHLCAAANNGVMRDEIQEALLQTAIYCGVPVASHTPHLVQTMFTEMDAEGAAKKQCRRLRGDATQHTRQTGRRTRKT